MRKIDGRPALIQYGAHLFTIGNAIAIAARSASLLWTILSAALIAYSFPQAITAARFYVNWNGRERT